MIFFQVDLEGLLISHTEQLPLDKVVGNNGWIKEYIINKKTIVDQYVYSTPTANLIFIKFRSDLNSLVLIYVLS